MACRGLATWLCHCLAKSLLYLPTLPQPPYNLFTPHKLNMPSRLQQVDEEQEQFDVHVIESSSGGEANYDASVHENGPPSLTMLSAVHQGAFFPPLSILTASS